MIVASVLARLDPRLEEAAADLGATGWQAFRLVTLPLMRNGVLAAAFVAFVLSSAEYTVSAFTSGRVQPLSVLVASDFRFHLSPKLNALAMLIVAFIFVIVASELVQPRTTDDAESLTMDLKRFPARHAPARRRGSFGAGEQAILGLDAIGAAWREIASWPGYAPTPLHMPGLARRLDLGAVRYKDEAGRFGLSFKALGGAYACPPARGPARRRRRHRDHRHRRQSRPLRGLGC